MCIKSMAWTFSWTWSLLQISGAQGTMHSLCSNWSVEYDAKIDGHIARATIEQSKLLGKPHESV